MNPAPRSAIFAELPVSREAAVSLLLLIRAHGLDWHLDEDPAECVPGLTPAESGFFSALVMRLNELFSDAGTAINAGAWQAAALAEWVPLGESAAALADEIAARLSARHMDGLSIEQRALLVAEDPVQICEFHAMLDDFRDRLGVDCDDIRPNGRLVAQLRRTGFEITHEGGGCQTYSLPPANGFRIVCVAAEGGLPDDDRGPVWLGIMSEHHSEEVAGQQFATGSELAHNLSFQPSAVKASKNG